MSADSGRGLARRLGRLRAAAGALGLASLAGCSSSPGDDGGTTGTTGGRETTAPGGGPTAPAQSPDPTPTPAATQTATPAVTLSTAECEDRVAELEAEREALLAEIEALEASLPLDRRRQENLERIATLFDPPEESVVATAKEIGTAAREAVVFLEAGGGTATGWYVDDHHVITNAHNVFDRPTGEARESTVWTLDGDRHAAELVGVNESYQPDVAVLRTDEVAPATLTPGSTPPGDSREPLVLVGHPGGIGNWMITLGTLRRLGEYGAPDGTRYSELESTVPGRQGVSGSPVLDFDGEVVGLTSAGTPVQRRQPDDPPIVADPVVYDRPIASLSYGIHVAIDDVMGYYEEWT